MKKIKLFILFVCVSVCCKSQIWCPAGAEWHYGSYNMGYFTPGYIKMNYVGDSTINTVTYKKLIYQAYGTTNGFVFNYPSNLILLNENNKLVTLYNGLTPQDTLFNFNAHIGDVWLRNRLGNASCDYTRRHVTVLDTGHVTINGMTLRKMVLNYEGGDYSGATPTYYKDTVYEKIGSINFFLNPSTCETQDMIPDASGSKINADFRCYSDNTFTLYHKPGSLNCTAVVSVNEKNIPDPDIKLYPNPATDEITVQLPVIANNVGEYTLSVFDSQGKELTKHSFQQQQLKLDVTGFNNGLYLAVVKKNDVIKARVKFSIHKKN